MKNRVIKVPPPKTAEEILARERERKARTTLLMALPEDLLAKFHKMWDAIKSRFGGNDESNKMQKYILKQQFEGFSVSNSEGLHKGYDRFQSLLSQLEIHGAGVSTEDANQKFLRSLPSSWSQVSLVMRTKPGVDSLSFDDLYNNLRVFESDVKGSTGSSSSTQNVAFVSSESTSSTNDVSTAYGVSTSSGYNSQRENSSSYTDELMESNSGSDTEVTSCSKECVESYAKLKKLYDEQREQLGDASIEIQAYTQALKKVEAQLVTHQKNQLWYEEKIRFMKIDLDDKTDVLTYHKKLLAEAVKEKEELKTKLENFQSSSKGLSKLLNSQMSKRDKSGLGYGDQVHDGVLSYENEVFQSVFDSRSSDVEDSPVHDRFANVEGMHAVPPPMTGNYMPSGPDREVDDSMFTYGPKQSKTSESDTQTSNFDSCESNSSVETLESVPEPVVVEPKVVSQPKVWSDAPIIEEYESDSDDEYVIQPSKEQEKPSFAFVNTVKHVKTPRETVKEQNTYSPSPKANKRDWNGLMSKRLGLGYGFTKKACFVCGNFSHLIKDYDFHEKRMAKQVELNKKKGKGTGQEENRPVWNNVQRLNHQNQFVPTADNPQRALKNKGIIDNGCFRHMTGNKAYLAEYQDYNGGHVAFGSSKGYITCKGKIKTGKLDFEDVCFVKELYHFNLFSVSQMCDKKNKVLFTDTECLVLSSDFKLPDENQVLLRIPRQNNMYSFYLENIVPSKGKGPNWLFDLDYLTDSMNYQPVRSENQANKTAGPNTQNNIDAGNSKMEAEPGQDYFVLPIWSSYTSTVKSSETKNEGKKPNRDTGLKTNEEPVDKEDQAFLEELERLKRQEKEANDAAEALRKEFAQDTEDLLLQERAARATSTNTINTASTPISTDSPSNIFSTGGLALNITNQDDYQIPALEDIYDNLSDGIFTNASYDDEGAVADFTNLESTMNVSLIPTSRIHSSHPTTQILRDPKSAEEPVQFKIQSYQMDVKSASCKAKIDKEVYFSTSSFVDPNCPKKVYKVVKALYGLHQAPRACQDKYVAEILKKFDFASVKTASTPIEIQKSLTKDEEAANVDVHLYRSMIGSLMYLTASRLDIMFVVCACSRFQVTPKTSYLNAVKRIFRKSIIGGCQFLGRRLILWQCKKQTIVATSTTEAEYVAAANCCGQVLWIQNQMLDYGFNFMNTKIYIDNESTICIVKNPIFHSKTKHIEIRHHFIRDAYKKKLIHVLKIYTDDNVADLLAKAFDVCRHQELASPEQMTSGKDFLNPLIVDSLPKTIWFINAPCFCNESLAIPGQTTTSKELSNMLMAGSLLKTTLPPKLLE
ncbi:putative ribonuclease H-like domain-containing protein [Tanacetum coccineum]